MAKTVIVNAIGLAEKDCRMIRNILSLANNKDQSYRLTVDSREPADIAIINADDATAMVFWNEYRQKTPDANVVLVSNAPPSESDFTCIKRPLIASQLHGILALGGQQGAPALQQQHKYDALKKSFLFRTLAPIHLQKLVALARTLSLPAQHTVFEQADAGEEMLVVLSGRLKISVSHRDGREVVLGILGPGEIFGEGAMLDGRGRSASAATLTACELLSIHRKDFMPFLEQNPKVAIDLLTVLALRLRLNTEQLVDLIAEHEAPR